MTKKELTAAIVNDMAKKSGEPRVRVAGRWSGWLNRQTKANLEAIYKARSEA